MQKRNYLIALLTCLSFPALADNPPTEDVGLLKQKIVPYRAAIDSGTQRARSLKLQMRGVTHEIGYDQCKDLENKIAAQYPLSPFRAIYKNGSTFSSFCDWNPERPSKDEALQAGKKYYFEPIQTKTQLGLTASYIVRIVTPLQPWPAFQRTSGEGQFLLDSNFRFLEINGRSTYQGLEGYDWDVAALTPQGDKLYYAGPGTGNRGFPVERAYFASGDGALSATWVKTPRRSDHGKEIIINRTYQVNKRDWQNTALILNQNFVHYFQYADEWTSRPNTYDWLLEVALADSGVEVCADGSSAAGKDYTHYKPSNNQDSWSCSNVW